MKPRQLLIALVVGTMALSSVAACDRGEGRGNADTESVGNASSEVSDDLAAALADCFSVVGELAALSNSSTISGPGKIALAQKISQVSTYLGNAVSIFNADSSANGAAAIAESLSQASFSLYETSTLANSSSIRPHSQALTELLARAVSVFGRAIAVANRRAQGG